jgi:hypothetical protein
LLMNISLYERFREKSNLLKWSTDAFFAYLLKVECKIWYELNAVRRFRIHEIM